MNKEDIIGLRSGRLVVTSYSHKKKRKKENGYHHYYNCKCDCGNDCIKERSGLRFGSSKSCGCIHKEVTAKKNREISKYNGESRSEYARVLRIYNAMIRRCYNKNDGRYEDYGGRGIKVCKEWYESYYSFKSWALSNGYSDFLSIDRIDVNGDYEPNNCRWATQSEQMNNTRVNKRITYQGGTKTLTQWCRELNLNYDRTKARFNTCGMTPEQAFNLPKQNLRRKINNNNI